MKTKLSPFVYKVKGNRNFLLYDSVNSRIFSISPEGDPRKLEAQLLENDLVIETEGVVPFKFIPNAAMYKKNLILKEVQIRITGQCNLDCSDCGSIGKCKKDRTDDISIETMDMVAEQLKSFSIDSLCILGGNVLAKLDLVEYIKSRTKAASYKLVYPPYTAADLHIEEKKHVENMGGNLISTACNIEEISEENMSVDVYSFHYHKQFNPCWGNKLSIDANGDIKSCLWSDKVLGNVKSSLLAHLVVSKKFDKYWEITKDKIETCEGCEFKYSCGDCRVLAEKKTGNPYGKTWGCSYCPDKGQW